MMSRNTYFFAILLSLAAAPAFAQIQWEGSVLPTQPVGFPPIGGLDSNQDGVDDFLLPFGNRVMTEEGLDPTDPAGGSGFGLPWNARVVWRNYDTAQNIVVGDAGQSGTLSIFSGGKLRYQHLVIGAVTEGAVAGATGLTVEIEDDSFNLAAYRGGAAVGGAGLVTISGFGSAFSNDPNLIDRGDQVALNLANGRPITDVVVDLRQATQSTGAITDPNFSTRSESEGFDVIVGLDGTGALSVAAGGRMDIQDALMVAVDSQSNGVVTVDGVGSILSAYGRIRLSANLVETRSIETASFVGGRGNGSLTVSGGGRAEFYNGLVVGGLGTGADLGTTARAGILVQGDGSGLVTVAGAGSTLNVYPSAITTGNLVGNRALVIGERRENARAGALDNPLLAPADSTLQQGTLVIGANAVVNVAGRVANATYIPGNAAIGKRGTVDLSGGRLQVDFELENDGTIKGYGVVRSESIQTSVYSVIRGGNASQQNPDLGDPLRFLLSSTVAGNVPEFYNRGLIYGAVEIEAGSLYTSETSQIKSGGGNRPIRIILNNDARADEADPVLDADDNFGALHNRGLIEGNLDFIVAGGVVNGDNYLPLGAPANGSSTGGTIRGSGRILAGQFINNAGAELRVRQGESLAIHTNGVVATFPSDNGLAGGVDAAYRTMNLGSISVTGGDLEIGYVASTGAPFVPFPTPTTFNTSDYFFNARYQIGGVNPQSTTGTIVSNDGNLHFTTGLMNAGVLAFTGGTNIVNGPVYNLTPAYNTVATPVPGAIIVSGNGTSVTFEDDVFNEGEIGIGPFGSVVNFLGNLTNSGTIDVAFDLFGSNGSQAAYITVQGGLTINGGTIGFAFLNQTPPAAIPNDFSVALLTAGSLSEDSLFTNLVLPDLPAGKYWDVIYDTVKNEIRLEIVMSSAIGADFNGDGVVSQGDIDVWVRNAGIESGASIIQGDANHDGKVDLADYDILMTQLYTGTPVAINAPPSQVNVPEPAGVLLAMLAAAPLVRRRR